VTSSATPATNAAAAERERASLAADIGSAGVESAEPAPHLVLDRGRPFAVAPPTLDEQQQQVLAHRRGALLVLAGPGTGKTTTLVEAMVDRLGGPDALRPEQILGLTFGRKAAHEWRERVTARVGGGLVPTVSTFHSFAYSLVRAYADPLAYLEPLRLLSGAEQEARLRELLQGSVRDGRLDWPRELTAALGTRGLAAEVRAVVAKARALGLDPDDLEALAGHAQVLGPAWAAVGRFLGEYLDVLDAEGVTDYTEVVHRAALLAHDPQVQGELRRRYRAVFVDEYQDTDPAQVRLLLGLVAPGSSFVAVGDPDQSIYTFRGADTGGILRFRDEFAAPDGRRAPVIVLGHTRRFGPVIRDAANRVLRNAAIPGLAVDIVRAHRSPECDLAHVTQGEVTVHTFDTASAEAAHIADFLRRAHLERDIAWDEMAVLVRSGQRSIGPMRRALAAAGVPVQVAGDEIPLHGEPAIAPLLHALAVAADLQLLDEQSVADLLLSPLADADPADLRRLGRTLRRLERAADPSVRPTPSMRLIRDLVLDLVADPAMVLPISSSSSSPDARARQALGALQRLAGLLRGARAVINAHGSTEDALWAVWSGAAARGGTGWPQRLEAAALRGGEAGRRADSDLDAVLALFAAAERAEDRFGGRRGVTNFLADLREQQIPADTLADRGVRGPAVRVLTAHRAKGLQWRVVIVASVQEGTWPDLRRRGTLLAPDRLEHDGLVDSPPAAVLLAEERRLFYVACTRAREQLVVTAVSSSAADGDQPSRFLDDLLGRPAGAAEHVGGRPSRPLSVAGLVASLRATSVDPAFPPDLRAAAARRLAVLAHARSDDGRPLVPMAHPDRWWGVREFTAADVPVRPEDEPLALSGSQLTTLDSCPLKWFLGHEVRADVARTSALGFGSVIHLLADAVARGELATEPAALDDYLDLVWGELGFEAPWQSRAERVAAGEAVRRFINWHLGRSERQLVASEASFEVTLDIGSAGVRLRGSFDRVELDPDGAVHIADLKTSKAKSSAAELAAHPQLGVYQVAVREGALDQLADDVRAAAGLPPRGAPVAVGGAELVLLRLGGSEPVVQAQAAIPEGSTTWVDSKIALAHQHVRDENFSAKPSAMACRTCDFRVACPAVDEGHEVLP